MRSLSKEKLVAQRMADGPWWNTCDSLNPLNFMAKIGRRLRIMWPHVPAPRLALTPKNSSATLARHITVWRTFSKVSLKSHSINLSWLHSSVKTLKCKSPKRLLMLLRKLSNLWWCICRKAIMRKKSNLSNSSSHSSKNPQVLSILQRLASWRRSPFKWRAKKDRPRRH